MKVREQHLQLDATSEKQAALGAFLDSKIEECHAAIESSFTKDGRFYSATYSKVGELPCKVKGIVEALPSKGFIVYLIDH